MGPFFTDLRCKTSESAVHFTAQPLRISVQAQRMAEQGGEKRVPRMTRHPT